MKNSRTSLLAGGALVLAALAAYHNSFSVPFVFDDAWSIQSNPTIRQLWPLSGPLSPPSNGEGVTGRPLVNLSLAVNYAFGGLDVRGYHVMNLVLHTLAGLTLWGVLRRTLRLETVGRSLRTPPTAPERRDQAAEAAALVAIPPYIENAELMAFMIALLWTVHPLLTESVVCVVQRTEVLGGLFYLLTLYCFIRAASVQTGFNRWQILAVVACFLGVASKEIVATAPLLVLLYDRTFVAGTFREAWQRRKWFFGALAATWLPLAWLMWHNQQRGRTVGFGLGISAWDYLLTQCQALVTYLKLSFWPHPLVVDYGVVVVKSIAEVWWQGPLIVALLLATGAALRRQPVMGFLGAWFFVILAPSSSIVPLTTQTIAEHRMYLPLIAVITLAVGAGAAWLGRRGLVVFLALAVGAGWLTTRRNLDYQDDLTLWRDTVEHQPANSRALAGVATAYFGRGNMPEARRYYAESLRLDPTSPPKQYNMGLVLNVMGLTDEAIRHYAEALRLFPLYAPAHANLAAVLVQRGQSAEAIPHLKVALTYIPDMESAHYTLGQALSEQGQVPEAIQAYQQAVKLNPAYAEARLNLGILLAQQGQLKAALVQLGETVRLRPEVPAAHLNLGIALAEAGRLPEAVKSYETALRLRPEYAVAHYNLGNALVQQQRWADARRHFEEAVRLKPDLVEAREMVERLQAAPEGP